MAERVYLIPVWLRVWHWTNALLMLTLMATGVSMHFAAPGAPVIRFDLARSVHNVAGLSLAALYAFFVIWNFVSGNWRQYVPTLSRAGERLRRQNHYFTVGLFKGEPHPYPPTPQAKFNIIQQVTYLLVMYALVPFLILTGMLFFFPELAPRSLFGMNGLLPIAVTHYVTGFLVTMFLLGHVYMGTTGVTPDSGMRMMLTGWHEHKE